MPHWEILGRGTVSLLLVLAAALAVLALISNRVQRTIRMAIVSLLCTRLFERRLRDHVLSRYPNEFSRLEDRLETLYDAVTKFMDVRPVTLFVLDPMEEHYVARRSTIPTLNCGAIPASDPLPQLLKRIHRLHDLTGRTDDLQNAPLYIINASVLRACDAACAVPLHEDGQMEGFLLCGGAASGARLTMRSRVRLAVIAGACAQGSKARTRTRRRASRMESPGPRGQAECSEPQLTPEPSTQKARDR